MSLETCPIMTYFFGYRSSNQVPSSKRRHLWFYLMFFTVLSESFVYIVFINSSKYLKQYMYQAAV